MQCFYPLKLPMCTFCSPCSHIYENTITSLQGSAKFGALSVDGMLSPLDWEKTMKKIILITGLMLSANLWAKYDYKLCSSFGEYTLPYSDNPTIGDETLERCLNKYLNLDYQLYGDPFIDPFGYKYQALLGFKR